MRLLVDERAHTETLCGSPSARSSLKAKHQSVHLQQVLVRSTAREFL
jgi:hypothetical protein